MKTAERLAPYAELAHLLLNTGFLYLTRRLELSDLPDRTLVPPAVAKDYDEVLFGGVLFECAAGVPCEIKTSFGVCFAALALWNGDGFVLLGPYLPERPEPVRLEEALAAHGVPPDRRGQYDGYCRSLPTLGHGKLRAALNVLAAGMYGESLKPGGFGTRALCPETPSPCPVFPEDSLQRCADAVARRYEKERLLMAMVARGDARAAELIEDAAFHLERAPNRLRGEKNLFLTLNTLLRKAIEDAQVHPFYIDAISAQWAVQIESAECESELYAMRRSMVEDYCHLVQLHSMAGYSRNVRSMLTYVQFHLSESISLDAIAQQLGVNASYLSSQFNREVGKSLPEYVSEKRVALARRLLQGSAPLSVGQIASSVGFADVNYFTKVFKKLTGLTPSAYRARHGAKRQTPAQG